MILRSWILDNIKGNVKGITLYSYTTGFKFSTDNPDKLLIKDLILEANIEITNK